MTVMEALQAIDSLKPNTYSQGVKIAWLSTLDGLLHKEILAAHVDKPSSFHPYTEASLGQELLAQEPYGRQLYLTWLESRMDYYNGDTARFNNSLNQFRSAYTEFARFYRRSHCPHRTARKFW